MSCNQARVDEFEATSVSGVFDMIQEELKCAQKKHFPLKLRRSEDAQSKDFGRTHSSSLVAVRCDL